MSDNIELSEGAFDEIHLCNSCKKLYPECDGEPTFTTDPKKDNIVSCTGFQDVEGASQ